MRTAPIRRSLENQVVLRSRPISLHAETRFVGRTLETLLTVAAVVGVCLGLAYVITDALPGFVVRAVYPAHVVAAAERELARINR
jgi:hypothetical protein